MPTYNGPVIPTTYDPKWFLYTNLNMPPYGPATILAFQSFPQDLTNYARTRRWLAEISGFTVGGIPLATQDRDQQKIAALKQAFDNGAIPAGTAIPFFDAAGNVQTVSPATATNIYNAVVAFVQATYTTAANLVSGINASPPTVTTRKQIDQAYAAIAPNSVSATNPSPT